MFLYDMARKIKGKYKVYQRARAGEFLSPVRRIERVAPISGGRFAAMTFDDGPSAMPTNPKHSDAVLTEDLLNTLDKYNAKGTFDVIGTTENNYPDTIGASGSFSWGGVRYDHYPDFEMDKLAGVKNQLPLARRMAESGHELTSHGYEHILFGKIKLIYGKRACFESIHEVISDLKKLDELVNRDLGRKIRAARPPHYVDKTRDGHSAYDAYRYLNYQYLAASFDGGGWKSSSGDYEKDVSDMVTPLETALKHDPNSLNGHIIFQKDGCSMSRLTPVADALEKQLKLLNELGYRIVTVSDLLSMSPFTDTGDTDPIFSCARSLISAGYCIAYKNNTLQPDRIVTLGELIMMSASPEKLHKAFCDYVDSNFKPHDEDVRAGARYGASPSHPYFHAVALAVKDGVLSAENMNRLNVGTAVTPKILSDILAKLSNGQTIDYSDAEKPLKKREVLEHLARALN